MRKQFLLYHQHVQPNNNNHLSVMNNVLWFVYEGIPCVVSYEASSIFEDMNNVCIFVYETDEDMMINSNEM